MPPFTSMAVVQQPSGVWLPKVVCMADVEPRPIEWLWPQRIALGRLSLLVGMPGAGKSFLTCDMAARISTGSAWPDGTPCSRGSVLLVTAEDDPGDTIRPRLDAHGADPSRVYRLAGLHRELFDGTEAEGIYTLADIGALDATLTRLGDCRLVVIDPIGSFLGGKTDANRDNEVRGQLEPVARLAEAFGCAVLVVAHRRKSAGAVADDTVMGSRGFTAVARAVWHLTRDPQSRERRLLLPGKMNLSAEQGGLAFMISREAAALRWESDPVDMSADDALAQEQGERREVSALDEAVAWLSAALADSPRPGKEVKAEAERDGITGRTLERARVKLRVIVGPIVFGGTWMWKLPDSASVRQDFPESAKDQTLADSGETVADTDAPPLLDDDDGDAGADWLTDSF
jgi:putative DNA primase/helicase